MKTDGGTGLLKTSWEKHISTATNYCSGILLLLESGRSCGEWRALSVLHFFGKGVQKDPRYSEGRRGGGGRKKASSESRGVRRWVGVWEGFSVDEASDPTPAEGAPFEVLLARSPSRLAAQMIDETFSRALRLYTHQRRQRATEGCWGPPAWERKREKMCKTCYRRQEKKVSHHTRI